MRTATIVFQPDHATNQINITTGGVSNLEMVGMLKAMQTHFAKAIVKEYEELTGVTLSDLEHEEMNDFDKYIDFIRANKL